MTEKISEDPIIYTLIRSSRRTLGLEIRPDASVLVRAPLRTSRREVDRFVLLHAEWIRAHQNKVLSRAAVRQSVPVLTEAELKELSARAASCIPERVAHYAPLVGVTYGRITIRAQRTRWGSCSAKGNLNFNCLLMLTPAEVIDSVVVHELCHRKQMNHSPRFYKEVLRVCPEYYRWNKWLKENGSALMARLPGS